ncbi:MAG: PEP-CTERM sorting domain-containing protein [Acidobacteriota bacterium]
MKKLFLVMALTAVSSFGSTLALTMSSPTTFIDSVDSFTSGWSFTITDSILISSLGYYDENGDGLSDSHDVGIFDSGGTLLVTANVASGTGAALVTDWRMVSVTPYLLGPGTYTVAGSSINSTDSMVATAIPILDPTFTLGATDLFSFGAFSNPTLNAGGGITYFNANFQFDSTGVPEPSTLLMSLSAFGLIGWKKREALLAMIRR